MVNIRHREKKSLFTLSKRQKDILVGSLLGDANVHRKGKECRVFFKHSANQLSLLKWKRREFEQITGMSINMFGQIVKGKQYQFGQFVTLTHPAFSAVRAMFYPKKRKIVPLNIIRMLKSPLSLAVWIMDDGAKDTAGLTIQTHSFNPREVARLILVLKKNFGLAATPRRNKGKLIIYFPKSQIPALWNIVGEYILDEYRYKFPVTP
jgi:LAGLIDADG DNA endonuclease family protein